jgi:hypothetical protein
MSEYQYYEWLAIDRPLDERQLAEVERLSSHMETVTPTQAIVTYSWGDFKHDPLKVLADHFDAFLYAANWGTTRLAFRFPSAAISEADIEPYLIEDVVTLTHKGKFTLLDIEINDESGSDWVDVEGALGKMAAMRQQIIDGDYRGLYLAWLASISRLRAYDTDEWDDEDEDDEDDEDGEDGAIYDLKASTEPPVPAGLASLPVSLKVFCDVFAIDQHLLKAAASKSTTASAPSSEALSTAIARLPRERCNDYLLRLLNDEPQLASALRKELGLARSTAPSDAALRPAGMLLAQSKRLAEQTRLREQEDARQARVRELEKLGQREESAWQAVDILLRQQKASSYDAAIRQLVDLRDLARHRGTESAFHERLNVVLAQYGKSRALMNRVRVARLLKEGE